MLIRDIKNLSEKIEVEELKGDLGVDREILPALAMIP
jgi:hypothetical protein